METYKIILIVLALIALLIIGVFISNYAKKSKGRKAEKRVARVLKKAGKKRKCKLMNNVYLPLYKGTCEIDHMLIGPFGVLVVETKGISGTVSGSGKNLVHTIGKQQHSLYNPQLQNKTHIDNVVYHLQKAGLKNVPVKGVVVFAAPDIVLESEEIGIYLHNLPDFVASLQNAGVPTDVVYDKIKAVKVSNPFKKLAHDIGVGRKKNND